MQAINKKCQFINLNEILWHLQLMDTAQRRHVLFYSMTMGGRPESEHALRRVMSSEQTHDERLRKDYRHAINGLTYGDQWTQFLKKEEKVQQKPFSDRRNCYIGLLGSFLALTREPLKVRRQVKYCKKGFREILQMSPIKKCVCILIFWEHWLSLFFSPFWASFL